MDMNKTTLSAARRSNGLSFIAPSDDYCLHFGRNGGGAADISPALYGAKLAKVLGECRLLRPPLSEKIDQPTELQLVSDVGTP